MQAVTRNLSKKLLRSGVLTCTVGLGLATSGCAEKVREPDVGASMQQSVVELTQSSATLDHAHFLAERSCLRAAGFDVPYHAASTLEPDPSLVGIAGLSRSVSAARTNGYQSTVKDAADPTQAYVETLSPSRQAAFQRADNGADGSKQTMITLSGGAKSARSESGCRADADRAVYGSVRTGLELDNFVNETLSLVDTPSIVRVLNRDLPSYNTCMAGAGFRVNGLHADELARKKFGKYRKPGEPPKAAEAKMAVTDAECQQKAGLVKETNDLFFTKASKWITEHEAQILGWQEDLDAAKRRAKKIIADA